MIVAAVIIAFVIGFAIAMEIGRLIYNRKMEEITAIADRIPEGILHFDKTHFTGVTIGGRKFLYCPVGNIISWSEGDYDHKWCEYEHKFFEELK